MKKQLLFEINRLLYQKTGIRNTMFTVLFLLTAQFSFAQKWNVIGNESNITATASNYTSITVVGDVPYIVYTETTAKVKKKNTDGSWSQVGTNTIGASPSFTRIYSDRTGKLYVAYRESNNKLAVVTYNTTTDLWERVGGSNVYVTDGDVNTGIPSGVAETRCSMAFDGNNIPYIVYAERGSTSPGAYVKRFNGTSWEGVGGGGTGLISSDTWTLGNSIAIDSNNVPYVIYIKQASTGTETSGKLNAYRYINLTWENLLIPDGTTGTATTAARHPSISMDSDNNPIICYTNTTNSSKATLLSYKNSSWSYPGNVGTRDASRTSLINDLVGNVYTIFHDALQNSGKSSTIRVYKRASGISFSTELENIPVTSPSGVGVDAAGANTTTAYTPASAISNIAIAIGTDTTKPYIVYTKTNSGGVVTPIVRVFDPLITSASATNITKTGASIGGEILSSATPSGTTITERGVVYNTSLNPTTANTKVVNSTTTTGVFTNAITGLTDTTTYYTRAYFIYSDGTSTYTVYGDNKIFTTANSVPVAVADAITVAEGGTATTLSGGAISVLANDTDGDTTDTLTTSVVASPTHGSLTLNTDGTFSYVHDGSETTSDSFRYKVNDGTVNSNEVTVTITVTAVNDTPVAVADAITVTEGGTATSLSGGATTVISNDTDGENNTLAASVVASPTHGTLTLNTDGTFSYVHDGSETTSDSFTYKANDGTADSNVVTVTITVTAVNDTPVAVADAITVAEGGTATTSTGGATSVLANDTDGENNTLTASVVANPTHGALTLNTNGTFSYVHDGFETTSDSFTYKANDGTVDSNVVTVTITVTAVNDAPVAVTENLSSLIGGTSTTLFGGGTSVLANDTDAENTTLNAILVTNVTNGSLNLNSNGTFTYVHNGTNTTSDSFTYKANDGIADSNIVTVNITITNLVAPSGLSYTTPNLYNKGTAITALNPTVGGGTVVSYSVNQSLPAGLSLNTTTGEISGTPTAITALTSYTVTATNAAGNTTASVTITVNDAAPTGLSYTSPIIYSKGTAITALNPTVDGGVVVSYSVNPSLPAGLNLNTTTGEISGTPTAITAVANYTITATNTGGNTTASITITVNDAAPTGLSYTTPNVYNKGTAITALNPTVGGGAVVSYSVNPSLPAGLNLNTTTGEISGTPTAIIALANYTITATNTTGNSTTSITITVNDVAPSGLSYTSPNVYNKGTAITALNPTVGGGAVVSYSINPSLPAGLSLNTTTGVISGTPTAVTAIANYTVTATNAGGNTTALVSIKVNDTAPTGLSYTSPNVYTKGTAITALNPTVGGGAVISYSVNPSLPAGLNLNTTTGVISGTPTAVAAVANYTVTATNTGGNTTATLSIKVNDVAPTGLSYTTPKVYTKGSAIIALNPTVSGGSDASYSVNPSLPAGLSLNTTTGVINGTPTVVVAVANYTITATNASGSTTAALTITVNDVAPSGLSYTTPVIFKKDRDITSLSPSVNGGAVVSYSISPSLPAGLSLDTTTGVISGTPTVESRKSNYVITASNTGGNTSSTISIEIRDISLKVSQGFSPNGDGRNDNWIVPNIVEYPNSIVRVFNTNGVQVFHSNDYQNNWNGRNEANDQELPIGSYLYQIDLGGDGTIDAQGWLYIAK